MTFTYNCYIKRTALMAEGILYFVFQKYTIVRKTNCHLVVTSLFKNHVFESNVLSMPVAKLYN